MAASAPRTAELYDDWGFEPVSSTSASSRRMEGCVTCLSVLVGVME